MLGTSQLQDARFTKRTVRLMVRKEAREAAKPGPVRPWGAGEPQERERVGMTPNLTEAQPIGSAS